MSLSGFPGQYDDSPYPTRDEIAIQEHLDEIDRLHAAQVAALHVLMDHPCAEETPEEEWQRLIANRYLEHRAPLNEEDLPELMLLSDSDSEWSCDDLRDEYDYGFDSDVDDDDLYAPVSPHVHFAPGLQVRFLEDDPMDELADGFNTLSLREGPSPPCPASPIYPRPYPTTPPSPLRPASPTPLGALPPPPSPATPPRRPDTPHPQLYVPPGRRPSQDPRVYYSTPIDGAFDTQPPSETRKAEYIAERVAANCHVIAKSPQQLTQHLLRYDDTSKLEILRLSEALRTDIVTESDPSPIVRVDRCAIHPYGFDFLCANKAGDIQWHRDIDLIHVPGVQNLIYEFWENAPRTLTLAQITALRQLPQYAFGEGERILAPMWSRALSQDQSVTAAYII